MSWKVHETDEVFAALRGLCSNSYRMYDPSEYRCYYDHDCETYECAVEEAAEEYERLVEHCAHQREQLAKRSRSKTIGILMELLNEYRESGCALDEDRVSWYAAMLDGRTVNERWMNGERTVNERMSITEELREAMMPCISDEWLTIMESTFNCIADRIDVEHKKAVERARMDGMDATFGDGWVKLPVDADGVPIHVGDELDGLHYEDGTVTGIQLAADGRAMVAIRPNGWDTSTWRDPEEYRHRKPDSWERIIEDAANFALDTQHTAGRISLEPFVERCKRLAGEGA